MLSLSAIYIADTMFFSPSVPAKKEIKLPQTNIALFLEKTSFQPPAQATKKVAGKELKNLAKIITPTPKETEQIKLSVLSTEDVNRSDDIAFIPLEKTKTEIIPEKLADNSIISPPLAKNIPVINADTSVKAETIAEDVSVIDENPIVQEKNIQGKIDIAESDLIPIESGDLTLVKTKVEVVDDAPKTQVAMIGNISAISNEDNALKVLPKEENEKEWQSMEDSPWVVAKSNQFAKNNKAVEDFSSKKTEEEISGLLGPQKLQEGETVQTAQVAKNILIPIPEDILNDENLTPQLVSPKKKAAKEAVEDVEEKDDSSKKGNFLKNITSIFSSKKEDAEDVTAAESKVLKKKNKKTNKSSTKILPAEMKLSFQPGRAQISGQTLRWIQAFALKATEEPDVILEIRIDKNSSYALQQRRLELLHTILGSKGIDDNKVSTVFTSREPNSFIIRTLRIGEEQANFPTARQQNKPPVYQTW